jgi:hypothetical protein
MANAVLLSKFQSLVQRKKKSAKRPDSFVFGKKMGIVTTLFGCWHENLGRPFTHDKTSYRSCMNCGARKQFNTETLETYGNFYAPPPVKEDRL